MNGKMLPAAVLVALVLSAGPAAAQCLPSPPDDGAAVTCSGTDSNGFVFGSADDLTVRVETGATVTNAVGLRAIDLDDRNTIEVRGTVSSNDADAIRVDDDGRIFVFDTPATITAAGSNGDGIDAGDRLQASVFGTIDAGKDGVNAGDAASVTVTAAGRVLAGDDGVQVGNDAAITNFGLIDAQGEGINAANGLILLQLGTVQGLDDALKAGERVDISNSGTIANVQTAADVAAMGEAQDGIDIDSGFVQNRATGRITSTIGDAIDFDPSTDSFGSTIDNFGLIKGGNRAVEADPADTSGQWIINRAGGRIEAGNPVALNLGGGEDRYDHLAGSGGLADAVLVGGISFGDGDDILQVLGRPSGQQLGGFGAGIDGGLGLDWVIFQDFTTADLGGSVDGRVLKLALGTGPDPFALWLRGFERFTFGDEMLTRREVITRLGGVVPVPEPASVLLLAGGLGLLGLLRRRKQT